MILQFPISLEKILTDAVKWSKDKKDYEIHNSLLEFNAQKYLDYLYSNSLYLSTEHQSLMHSVSYIAQKYVNCIVKIDVLDIQNEIDLIESQMIKSLSIPQNIDCGIKENIYVILKSLCNKYKVELRNLISQYSREYLLKVFYTNASVISYISAQSRYWDLTEEINVSYINLISETLNAIYKFNSSLVNNLLGSEKKSFEYLIHYILNSPVEFQNIDDEIVDIEEVLKITRLLISTEQLLRNISFIYKSKGTINIENNQIYISSPLNKQLYDYFNLDNENIINLQSEEINNIYKEFERKRGYSPFLLEEYLFKFDEKFLETRTFSTLIEDKALIFDIYSKTNQSEQAIKNMLEDLSLIPTNDKDIYTQTFSNDNRLFRTPLIKISNYYLISYFTLSESSIYFRYRILKNEIRNKLDKKLNHLVKEDFNELSLIDLKDKLENSNIPWGINFEFNQYLKCKYLFENRKELPQEIDGYFIKNNYLYLVELKNKDLHRSLNDISKSVNKTQTHLKSLNMLKKVIQQNKLLMQDVLGGEFSEIKIFLTHKFPHFLDGSYDEEYEIAICSFKDLLNYCDKILLRI